LLGYVSHQNGDIAAEAVRNISGVKQIIKAFQYGD
jgi:osmotically-inducible protein OsmY